MLRDGLGDSLTGSERRLETMNEMSQEVENDYEFGNESVNTDISQHVRSLQNSDPMEQAMMEIDADSNVSLVDRVIEIPDTAQSEQSPEFSQSLLSQDISIQPYEPYDPFEQDILLEAEKAERAVRAEQAEQDSKASINITPTMVPTNSTRTTPNEDKTPTPSCAGRKRQVI